MTKQRFDQKSTEFGLWLRKEPAIDSSLGYIASNVDYVWRNYKTGDWMLIEEKRFMATLKRWQKEIFNTLDQCCHHDPHYRGFHLIQFEHTSPDDGKIFLDGSEISLTDLIEFLKFSPVKKKAGG